MQTMSPRRGYTLVELLVVITIAVILIAAALPIAKRMMDDSRSRDAARLLSGQFTLGRTYAAKNIRPFGVELVLEQPVGAPAGVRHCTRMFLAEVQPAYAGATPAARGVIRLEIGQTKPEFVPLIVPLVDSNSDGQSDQDMAEKAVLLSLIDPGDTCLVKFEYKGDWFRLVRGTADTTNPLNASFPDPQRLYLFISRNPPPAITPTEILGASLSGKAFPPSYFDPLTIGYRYQVLRMPRRVGNPIELPAGTSVDMEYSGMGTSGSEFGLPANRVIVMFAASGAIDGLVLDNLLTAPTGTIHFLVGNVDKVNDPVAAPAGTLANPTNMNLFDARTSNLADANSAWVSVGRNGSIATSDNLPPPIDPTTLSAALVRIFPGDPRQQDLVPTAQADRATYLSHCREVASGRQQMGGE